MTQRKFQEIHVIPWRSSSWISCKGTCFTQGLLHTGIYYAHSMSFSYEQITRLPKPVRHSFQSIFAVQPERSLLKNKFDHYSSSTHLNILTVFFYSYNENQKVFTYLQGSAGCGFWLCPPCGNSSHRVTFHFSEHTFYHTLGLSYMWFPLPGCPFSREPSLSVPAILLHTVTAPQSPPWTYLSRCTFVFVILWLMYFPRRPCHSIYLAPSSVPGTQ